MLSIAAALLLSQTPAPAEGSDLARLAREVAREREAVEVLAADVETSRQAARAELLALEARERDAAAQLESTSLRIDALRTELARMRELRAAGQTEDAREQAAVRAAIVEARALLDQGVPHDLEARAARLAHAEQLLDTAGVGAAAPAVWQHLTAERALAEEVGLGRQPVAFVREGKNVRVLADTLHVGLALLFFKTGGGTVGYAIRERNEWRFSLAPDADARARILALFEAARHGTPQGTFLVPNALPTSISHGGAR